MAKRNGQIGIFACQKEYSMKAWEVWLADEWLTLVHAETAGKAKMAVINLYGDDYSEYIDYRAKRMPKLDNKPFTYKTCLDAGFQYHDEDGLYLNPDEFINDCPCEICITITNI